MRLVALLVAAILAVSSVSARDESPPRVTSVSGCSNTKECYAGLTITVLGQYFTSDLTLSVGTLADGSDAIACAFTNWASNSQALCSMPPAPAQWAGQPLYLKAANTVGSNTVSTVLRFLPLASSSTGGQISGLPMIQWFQGSTAVGGTLSISGQYLSSVSVVQLGVADDSTVIDCTNVSPSADGSMVTCTMPTVPSSWFTQYMLVTVYSDIGQSPTVNSYLTFAAPVMVPSVSFVTGCDNGNLYACNAGDTITVTGSSFTNTYEVIITNDAFTAYSCYSVSVVTDSLLTCQLPTVDSSFYSVWSYVTVTNTAGSSQPFSAFQYAYPGNGSDSESSSVSVSISLVGWLLISLGIVLVFLIPACLMRVCCGIGRRTGYSRRTPPQQPLLVADAHGQQQHAHVLTVAPVAAHAPVMSLPMPHHFYPTVYPTVTAYPTAPPPCY